MIFITKLKLQRIYLSVVLKARFNFQFDVPAHIILYSADLRIKLLRLLIRHQRLVFLVEYVSKFLRDGRIHL
jgi:hypothetical protein